MKAHALLLLASVALALTSSSAVRAGPLDPDTPACALARAEPTDGNIEACTGQPIDLRGYSYAFLATHYTEDGPVIYVLDTSLTGSDCIARMEGGVTVADALGVIDERTLPSGEGHVPDPGFNPDWSESVLSCEFDQDESDL